MLRHLLKKKQQLLSHQQQSWLLSKGPHPLQ